MGSDLQERFYPVVRMLNASCVQTSTTNTAATVTGSSVTLLENGVIDGMTFRWKVTGTLTGGNAAFTLKLYWNSTTLLTLTSDAATAVDWVAEIVMRLYGGAVQKICGFMLNDSEDPDVDYAAGTTDLRGGGTLKLVITSGNSGDTVTTEMVTVESWTL